MKSLFARGTLALLALLVALPYPRPARAADPPTGSRPIRVDLAIFVGPQGYKMADVNKVVDARNAEILADPIAAASGLHLPAISRGSSLGSGVRVWPKENIVIAADYTSLKSSSDDNVPVNDNVGAPKLKAQVAAPAHSVGLTVGYFFLKPLHWIRLGAGVGGAYYICNGKAALSFPWFQETHELHGTGLGAHGMMLGDIHISSRLHLEMALGYRVAKTRDLKDAGAVLLNADGSKRQADYSGLLSRFGLDIPFGPR
jgi:hypothetical protein